MGYRISEISMYSTYMCVTDGYSLAALEGLKLWALAPPTWEEHRPKQFHITEEANKQSRVTFHRDTTIPGRSPSPLLIGIRVRGLPLQTMVPSVWEHIQHKYVISVLSFWRGWGNNSLPRESDEKKSLENLDLCIALHFGFGIILVWKHKSPFNDNYFREILLRHYQYTAVSAPLDKPFTNIRWWMQAHCSQRTACCPTAASTPQKNK